MFLLWWEVALETAIAFWEMIIPLTPQLEPTIFKPDYLQWWFELLRSRNKAVTRDTWNLVDHSLWPLLRPSFCYFVA